MPALRSRRIRGARRAGGGSELGPPESGGRL